jgi:hypothetical protein
LSQEAYFTKDSITTYGGMKLINLYHKYCQVTIHDSTRNYSPYQVSEYRTDEGRIYIAKKVALPDSIQMVFLEVVVSGKNSLYYYNEKKYKTFFVSNDSINFIELAKSDKINNQKLSNNLKYYLNDCPQMHEASKLAKYNRHNLKEFFDRLNNCENKYYPFFKYGINIGVQLINLEAHSNLADSRLNQMNYRYEGGLTAGFFLDIPLFPSSFSVYTGGNVTKHGFSYSKRIESFDVDFVQNTSSLKIPIMLKYGILTGSYRPYAAAGVTANYHFINKGEISENLISGNVITIGSPNEISAIENLQYGIVADIGVERKLSHRKYLNIGLRYSKVFSNNFSFGSTEISSVFGINF